MVPCAAVFALALFACGGGNPPPRAVEPHYAGEQAALFSDLFRPELFGIEGSTQPEADALLDDRLQLADTVVPVRVVTISRETRGQDRNYTIVVRPTAEVLHGKPIHGSVSLTVAERSPAMAWLDVVGEKWVGTRLLLLLRNYQDGPHFYGTVDSVPVRNALARVKLEQVSGPPN